MKQTRDSITNVWGERTPHDGGKWPVRVDQRISEKPDEWVQSACVLCSNGCALDIGVKDGRIVGVRGRRADRANRGRLGPKGLHGWDFSRLGNEPLLLQNCEYQTLDGSKSGSVVYSYQNGYKHIRRATHYPPHPKSISQLIRCRIYSALGREAGADESLRERTLGLPEHVVAR